MLPVIPFNTFSFLKVQKYLQLLRYDCYPYIDTTNTHVIARNDSYQIHVNLVHKWCSFWD